MIIQQITYYLQGRLTENEAMYFWESLLADSESFEIFETFLYLKEIYSDIDPARKDSSGSS